MGGVVDGTGTRGSSWHADDGRPGWRRSFDRWPRWLRVAGWLLAWPLLGADGARRRLDLGDLDPHALRTGGVATAAWLVLIVVVGATPAPTTPLTLTDVSGAAAAERDDQPPPQPSDGLTAPSEADELEAPPVSAAVPATEPTPVAQAEPSTTWTVRRVVDGDTLEAVAPDGGDRRIRLAQVDAPEVDECFGGDATAELERLAGPGTAFTLRRPGPPYTDTYDRTLGELVLTDGSSVNVRLVRRGAAEFGDGFADEDADLAERMGAAEAAARAEGAGLWSACSAPPPPPAEPTPSEPQGTAGIHSGRTGGGWSCHPAYRECLPDGPDLDCAEVGHQVVLLGNADPYRLDGNSTSRQDGVGCESYAPWSSSTTYPYE